MSAAPREWDAATYQRISVPHEEWAEAVLARLPLAGEETVLDAGCGTGRVTRMLIERLPEGRVDRRRRLGRDGREGARDPPSAGRGVRRRPGRARAARAGRRGRLQRRLPLDPRPRRAVPPPAGLPASRAAGWSPSAAARATSTPSADAGRAVAAARALRARTSRTSATSGSTPAPRRPKRACAPPASSRSAAGCEPWRGGPARAGRVHAARSCSPATVDRLPAELRDRFVADVLAAAGEPLTLDYVRLNIDAVAGALT